MVDIDASTIGSGGRVTSSILRALGVLANTAVCTNNNPNHVPSFGAAVGIVGLLGRSANHATRAASRSDGVSALGTRTAPQHKTLQRNCAAPGMTAPVVYEHRAQRFAPQSLALLHHWYCGDAGPVCRSREDHEQSAVGTGAG